MRTSTNAAAGLVSTVILSLHAVPLAAQDMGDRVVDLTDQFSAIPALLGVLSFIIGIGLIIMGIVKFKTYTSNPNDPSASPTSAGLLLFVGGLAIAIPAVADLGIATLLGQGAETTNSTGGGFDAF